MHPTSPGLDWTGQVDQNTTLLESFRLADDVLLAGVKSVTDLMTMPGLINLDFADVQSVMSGMGNAIMGTGQATGEDRALRAAEDALKNPLLGEARVMLCGMACCVACMAHSRVYHRTDGPITISQPNPSSSPRNATKQVSIRSAKGMLVNITGGPDMTLHEVDQAAQRVTEEVEDETANIIFGSAYEASLAGPGENGAGGSLRVSIVATGIDELESVKPTLPPAPRSK